MFFNRNGERAEQRPVLHLIVKLLRNDGDSTESVTESKSKIPAVCSTLAGRTEGLVNSLAGRTEGLV
jgi:hypothetical protein